VLLSTVALHLILHWQWVVAIIRGRSGSRSAVRISLAIAAVLALAGLMVAPFFSQVQQTGEPPHRMQSIDRPTDQINGSTTLHEVEEQTGVPTAAILSELGLPAGLPVDERLGRLRKQYGFEMHDLQEAVRRHRGRR
jgi:hypothetical protein